MNFLSKGIGGIKWISISRFSRQILQFITSIFLARILIPEDFGVVSLGLIFFGFLTTFRDFGIGSAIIYIEKFNREIFSTAYWINVSLSLVVCLGTYTFSSSIVWLLSPDLETSLKLLPIIQFFSLLFLFNGITSLHISLLERELQFNKLAIFEIISIVIASISAIILGLLYRNEWSLIAQTSITLIINGSLATMYSPYRPRISFNITHMKQIIEYSSNLSFYSFINYLVRNADYFLIGKFLGSTSLGYYSLAYRIILYPVINISNVFSRVMLPIYARLKNDHVKLKNIFNLISYFIYILVLPYFTILFIFSEEFVNHILSAKWQPIIEIIYILIPIGIIQASSVTTGSIYQALGRTKELLKWGLFSGAIFILSFVVGINFGIFGVALSYMLANLLLAFFWLKIPFNFIEQKVSDFLYSLKKIFLWNFIVAAVLFVLKNIIIFFSDNLLNTIVLIFTMLLLLGLIYGSKLRNEISVNYKFLRSIN